MKKEDADRLEQMGRDRALIAEARERLGTLAASDRPNIVVRTEDVRVLLAALTVAEWAGG